MFEKEIKEALLKLSEVSSFLSGLMIKLNEFIPGDVESSVFLTQLNNRFIDARKQTCINDLQKAFNEPFNGSDCSAVVDSTAVSKFNKKCVYADDDKESDMFIDIPGASVGKKARPDGRFQGYIILKNEKHYVYGRTRKEVFNKIKKILEFGVKKKKRTLQKSSSVPSTFTKFTMYYFENFRIKKVAKKTYANDLNRFKNYLNPFFSDTPIKKILPADCQKLIDSITKKGLGKTADEVYSLLSIIFKGAILHDIIKKKSIRYCVSSKA